MKKLKIAAVSYVNTLPFLHGLNSTMEDSHFELMLKIPSLCKEYFENKKVDIALLPVAGLIHLQDYRIFSNYCIGCEGAVKTVALFSQVPFNRIETITLDPDSITSNQLIRFLCEKHWKIDVRFKYRTSPQVRGEITEAHLMIGDKAFEAYHRFQHVYDLGEEWKKLTGQPFVFAVWVAHLSIGNGWLDKLNLAFSNGIQSIDQVIEKYDDVYPEKDLESYFKKYISYEFDEPKKEALKTFLTYINDIEVVAIK